MLEQREAGGGGTYQDGFSARDGFIEGGNVQRILSKIFRKSEQKRNTVDPHQECDRHSNLGCGYTLTHYHGVQCPG